MLQALSELGLARLRNHVQQRNGGQIVGVAVAEEFRVRLVAVDVHAFVHVGDRGSGRVQEQLIATLGLLHRQFGIAASAALREIVQFAFQYQHEAVVFAEEKDVRGADFQSSGESLYVRAVLEKQYRKVGVGLADARDRLGGVETGMGVAATHHQIPALASDGALELLSVSDVLGPRGVTGVTQLAHQFFGHVLRRVRDDQVERFGCLHGFLHVPARVGRRSAARRSGSTSKPDMGGIMPGVNRMSMIQVSGCAGGANPVSVSLLRYHPARHGTCGEPPDRTLGPRCPAEETWRRSLPTSSVPASRSCWTVNPARSSRTSS